MTTTHRLLIIAAAVIFSAFSAAPASACSLPASGYFFSPDLPEGVTLTPDGVIAIPADVYDAQPADLEITVSDAQGQPIAGSWREQLIRQPYTEPPGGPDMILVIWSSEAPLEAGAEVTLDITTFSPHGGTSPMEQLSWSVTVADQPAGALPESPAWSPTFTASEIVGGTVCCPSDTCWTDTCTGESYCEECYSTRYDYWPTMTVPLDSVDLGGLPPSLAVIHFDTSEGTRRAWGASARSILSVLWPPEVEGPYCGTLSVESLVDGSTVSDERCFEASEIEPYEERAYDGEPVPETCESTTDPDPDVVEGEPMSDVSADASGADVGTGGGGEESGGCSVTGLRGEGGGAPTWALVLMGGLLLWRRRR